MKPGHLVSQASWKQTAINPTLRKLPLFLMLLIGNLAALPVITGAALFYAFRSSSDETWIVITVGLMTLIISGTTIALFIGYYRMLMRRASWLIATQQAGIMEMTAERTLGRGLSVLLREVGKARAFRLYFQPVFQSTDQINALIALAKKPGESVKVYRSTDLPATVAVVWRAGILVGSPKP